jgi:hypothetical protein
MFVVAVPVALFLPLFSSKSGLDIIGEIDSRLVITWRKGLTRRSRTRLLHFVGN